MRRSHGASVIAVAAACAIAAAVAGGVSARGAAPPGVSGPAGSGDQDARVGTASPTAVQLAEAAGSGLQIRWNTLGTPSSISRTGGYIATGLPKDALTAAHAYIDAHRDLLGLAPGVDLQLLGNAPLGKGRALLFRQTIDGVPLAPYGLLNMAVVDGNVVYLSSSLTRGASLSGTRSLSLVDAYRDAAAHAGMDVAAADVTVSRVHG